MMKCFADIDAAVKERISEKPPVMSVAAAAEAHVLEAVCTARNMGIAGAVLVGDEHRIRSIAEEHHHDLNGMRIVDVSDVHEAAKVSADLVRTGHADILMKGLLDTAVYVKAILDKNYGLRGTGLLSFVSVFEIINFNRLLLITDPAINMEPGLEEKEQIMKNAVLLARALGNDCPKAALISPIEKLNPKITSTLHAAAIAEKYRGSTDFIVDGPFALDIAVSMEAAEIKGVASPVAGSADILIVNDLGVGNVLYKSLVYFAGARMGGIVLGAKAPVIITSRSDSADAKLNSIKLSILLSDYLSGSKDI
jgi:phosphate butyryltransferase